MPTIKEIVDSNTDNVTQKNSRYPSTAGSDEAARPHMPSIAEMRDSQQKGSEGKGFSESTLVESLAKDNMGTSSGE